MGMRLNASISGHACFEKIQISGNACFEKIQGKCDSMHLFLAMHVSRKSKENATQCIYFWPCMFRENPRKMRLNASISGHACFEKIQISGHACFEKIQGKCDSMHLFLAMHVSRKSKENATQCIYLRRSMGAGK